MMTEPTGQIVLMLPDPGFLIGRGAVLLFVDGQEVARSDFRSRTIVVDVPAGTHEVHAVLGGLVKRESNRVAVQVPPEGKEAVYVNYSRFWGTFVLSTHH